MTNLLPIRVGVLLLALLGSGQWLAFGQSSRDASPTRLEKGKRIFEKHCAGCHGPQGKGDGYRLLGPDPANLTASAMKKKSDAALLKAVHEGKSIMPSWNVRLSEQDSQDVLLYIRTLSK